MSAPVRLALFALAAVVALGAGLGVGALVGPFEDDAPAPAHGEDLHE